MLTECSDASFISHLSLTGQELAPGVRISGPVAVVSQGQSLHHSR